MTETKVLANQKERTGIKQEICKNYLETRRKGNKEAAIIQHKIDNLSKEKKKVLQEMEVKCETDLVADCKKNKVRLTSIKRILKDE